MPDTNQDILQKADMVLGDLQSGGALPEADIPSVGIVFSDEYKAANLLRKFRLLNPPVIGRIENDCFLLDLKAVLPDQLEGLSQSIKSVIGS